MDGLKWYHVPVLVVGLALQAAYSLWKKAVGNRCRVTDCDEKRVKDSEYCKLHH